MLRQQTNGSLRTQDASFFARDLRQRIAEEILVIKVDVGDHGDQGINNIRRIQPTAKTYFKYRQIDPGAGEVFESHGGEHFKKAGMPWQLTAFHQIMRAAFNAVIDDGKFGVADWLLVDLDTLIHAQQVRRGIESGAIASRLHDAGERRRRGTFAVGAGDQYTLQLALRIA